MKRCLKCNQIYTDESLNYCLNDGTTLTIEGEEQTVVIQKEPPRKKSRFLLWFGLIGLLLFAGISLIAGYFIYNFLKSDKTSRTEKQNISIVSPTPGKTSTPKASPTSTKSPDNSASQNEDPKSSPTEETSDEFTPISWTTTTNTFKGETGQIYKFQCPPDGTAAAVWGSDIYTGDSSICTAAVHAGIITLEEGGNVTVEYRAGRSIYGSTVRNGITTYNYGEFPRSFVVR